MGDAAMIMLLALGIDCLVGWPDWVFNRIGHPVTWIGALIGGLDRACNRDGDSNLTRRAAGVAVAVGVIAVAAGAGWIATLLLPEGWPGRVLAALLAWPLLAARSLHDHVAAVARPLARGDIAAARQAVGMIVGRDPSTLDAAGVTRASIESLAENCADGIVAPVLWGVVLGLPGIAAYKAINTLDSMIGHRTPQHEAFGWAAARIDDVANLVPARLTGLLFAVVSGRPLAACTAMLRDAPRHRSPNAGWPEAAVAGALGIRLSGPRIYAGRISAEPWVNDGAADPQPADLAAALALYRLVMLVLALMLALPVLF